MRGACYTDDLIIGHMRAGSYKWSMGNGHEEAGVDAEMPTHVDLRESKVTDSPGIEVVARACGESLRSIDISQTAVGDEGLAYLAKFCPNLVSVKFNCTRATDRGVAMLAKALGDTLLRLDARACAVSDDGARALADSCSRLRVAGLDSTHVTIKGLVSLSERCKDLNRVTCAGQTQQPRVINSLGNDTSLGALACFRPSQGPVHDQCARAAQVVSAATAKEQQQRQRKQRGGPTLGRGLGAEVAGIIGRRR